MNSQVAIVLCLFALQAHAFFDFSAIDVDKFTPHPSCHYNVTSNSAYNVTKTVGQWYFDSVYSPQPLTGITCFQYQAQFNGNNQQAVGTLEFRYIIKAGSDTLEVECSTQNNADAIDDFEGGCRERNVPGTFGMELRMAMTDYTTFALVYTCDQDQETRKWGDAITFLSRSKQGLTAARRQQLLDLMAQYGWDTAFIRKIPTQSGC